MAEQTEWITRSEAGRRLGVSHTMIGKYVQRGAPTRSDKLVPWPELEAWHKRNIVPEMSGNYHARQRAQREQPAPESAPIVTDPAPIDVNKPQWEGVFWLMNQYRRPQNVRIIAEFAVAHGCTAAQAYGIAKVYEHMLVMWTIPDGCEDLNLVEDHDEPDWARIAELAGEPLDVARWQKENRKRVSGFEKTHPEW